MVVSEPANREANCDLSEFCCMRMHSNHRCLPMCSASSSAPSIRVLVAAAPFDALLPKPNSAMGAQGGPMHANHFTPMGGPPPLLLPEVSVTGGYDERKCVPSKRSRAWTLLSMVSWRGMLPSQPFSPRGYPEGRSGHGSLSPSFPLSQMHLLSH